MDNPATNATSLERRLAHVIVTALNLEDIDAETLSPETPLFLADDGGLGLDSIDALEIALAIAEHFQVEIRVGEEDSDEEELRAVFRSVRSLAAYIEVARAEKSAQEGESAATGHPAEVGGEQ